MKRLILLLALSGPVWADDLVARTPTGDMLRLADSPCLHAGTLALIKPEWRDKFRRATAIVNGKQWWACWIAHDDGVYVKFEDGDNKLFPLSIFKREPGV